MSKKILVVRFGSLGDLILTSAALTNLKVNFPGSRISLMTKPQYQGLAERMPAVDETICLQSGGMAALYSQLLTLDKESFDIIVDLHGNPRSWLTRKLVSADSKVVYSKRSLDRFRAVRSRKVIPSYGEIHHTIDMYNECVTNLGGRAYCRRPQLRFRKLKKGAAGAGRPSIVIAPGAKHAPKRWPIYKFADLAAALHQREGARIIWAITSDDVGKVSFDGRIDANHITELVDSPIENLIDQIAGADLTISNDSGIGHLSSAVNTPTAVIFGPTHPILGFAPRGMLDRVIEVEEDCRPCSRHGRKECFRSRQYCFTRIEVDTVQDAAREMLKQSVARKPALFVDRDGTLIVDKHFLSDPGQVEFEEGAVEALRIAGRLGLKIVILSNQSGVARGHFLPEIVESVNRRLLELLAARGVDVDGVYFCPHLPGGKVTQFAVNCGCRKPAPEMAEQAARELGINLRCSYVVGDKLADVNLARVIGADPYLVLTGHGKTEKELFERSGDKFMEGVVTKNLLDAVRRIEKSIRA